MLNKLSRTIRELFLPACSDLDGGGERVDLDYNKKIPFDLLDLYQKSHYRRYEFAKSVITAGGLAGDFACGTGYGSVMLSEVSSMVTGIDICADVITAIRRRYKDVRNVEFLSTNLKDLKYLHWFDNIVSFETVEHMDENDIPALFKSFNRALKPGGTFVFSTPYMQETTSAALASGFHKTYHIDEAKVHSWLTDSGFVAEATKYQNYQTHDIVDQLIEKDFMICVARRQ